MEVDPKKLSVAQAQKLRRFMEDNRRNRSVREAERLGMTSRVNKAIQKSHTKDREMQQQQRLAAQNLQEQQRLAIQQQTEYENLAFQQQAEQQRLALHMQAEQQRELLNNAVFINELSNSMQREYHDIYLERLQRAKYNAEEHARVTALAAGATQADALLAAAAAGEAAAKAEAETVMAEMGLEQASIAPRQQLNDEDMYLNNLAESVLDDPEFLPYLVQEHRGGLKRKKKSKKIKSYKRKTNKKRKQKKKTKKI